MNYAKVLPATGGTGLVFGGIFISQAWVLGVALVAVLVGAVFIRFAWRKNKQLGEI